MVTKEQKKKIYTNFLKILEDEHNSRKDIIQYITQEIEGIK